MSQPSQLARRILYELDRQGLIRYPECQTLDQRSDTIKTIAQIIDDILTGKKR